MKRAIATVLFIVLVPFAAAGTCKKDVYCPNSPSGDCNPRPSAPAPSPTHTDQCAISGTTGSCVASPKSS